MVRAFAAIAVISCLVSVPAAGQQRDAAQAARSIALFREAGKVLQHPRCLNCHPAGDRPSQTETMRPHNRR